MIVLEIDSGLGNQMFMYAASKALAVKHNTNLYLDVDVACKEGYGIGQTFQLTKFNISAGFVNREIMKQFDARKTHSAYYDLIRSSLRKSKVVREVATLLRKKGINPSIVMPVGSKNQEKIYEEPDEDWVYKPEFLELPDNVYIRGYFPSYKYFDNIRDLIIDEFTLKNDLSMMGREAMFKIESSNSISVHFRRGDVVANPKYRSWYDGVVTDKYYRNAIDYFAENVDDPHFFIFSNEIEWVKQNFKIPGKVTYVDHNKPESGYEDLFLMSRCKHNVTTGCSSFSWWAAYLNLNSEKIVIRTHRMNYHDHLNHPDDFFPNDWKVVES
jgi:hypothetical protein